MKRCLKTLNILIILIFCSSCTLLLKYKGYDKYYINKNKQENGDNEIHLKTCRYFPKKENALCLGQFENCESAKLQAKENYENADGCFYCLKKCHER